MRRLRNTNKIDFTMRVGRSKGANYKAQLQGAIPTPRRRFAVRRRRK